MTTIAPAPATTEVTTRDVLHRAADLLEEFGWCQGALAKTEDGKNLGDTAQRYLHPRAGQFCVGGAFFRANVDLGRAWHTDGDLLQEAFDWQLVDFNNAPGRTKAEVVAKLREAAERT